MTLNLLLLSYDFYRPCRPASPCFFFQFRWQRLKFDLCRFLIQRSRMLEVDHAYQPVLPVDDKIVAIHVAMDETHLMKPAERTLATWQIIYRCTFSI
jgi:hypothetical protein